MSTDSETLRVLIAEDESLAREALTELVIATEGFELVGVFADGASALAGIDALEPEVAFLDIRMPELSGLQVVERMRARPWVVFMTAYDSHAVSAFELGAIDYILKPFDASRFAVTCERLRTRFPTKASTMDAGPGLVDRLRLVLDQDRRRKRIYARVGADIVPLDTDRITHILAEGDYCTVHIDGRSYLVSATIGTLEKALASEGFLRVHRAHLVNMDKVTSIVAHDERRLELRLGNGARIVASRTGSKRVRDLAL